MKLTGWQRYAMATDDERKAFGIAEWFSTPDQFFFRFKRSRHFWSVEWPTCKVEHCDMCQRQMKGRTRLYARFHPDNYRVLGQSYYVCIGCLSRVSAYNKRAAAIAATRTELRKIKEEISNVRKAHKDRDDGAASSVSGGHAGWDQERSR